MLDTVVEFRSGRSKPESEKSRNLPGPTRHGIIKPKAPSPHAVKCSREVNAVYHAGLGIMLPHARSIRRGRSRPRMKSQQSHQKVVKKGVVVGGVASGKVVE